MKKAEILIVEDDAIVARDIQNRLKALGFLAPTMAPSGEKAIERVREHKPDLVLMDIMLKGEMDGIEAAGQISTQFNIPVVYLTAYADEKVLERAKVTEPFGYIIKPFEDRDLNTAIEIALYKHKMEKQLKESEEWLSTTLKSIGDAVIATDKNGHVTFMNPVAEFLTGWNQKEARGRSLKEVFNIINEQTRKGVEDPVAKVIREGTIVGLANHTVLIARDGTEIAIDDSGAPIKNEKGAVTGVVLVFRDVRQRRQTEDALRETEERYQALFENNPIETIVVDKDARITMYNKAKRLSGDRLPQIGDVMYKDYAAGHLIDMDQELMECIQLGKSKDFSDQNYKGRFLDIRMSPFKQGAIITAIDRTEKKDLETKLRRTQKMESLGLMAGGIAHDLNNILSGIVSYPELLLMDLPEDSPLRKPIETIKESGMRAADVVSDLLTIARGVATGKDVLNLNTMVEEYLDSAEHKNLATIYSFVTFKIDFDNNLLNIICSSTHIRKSLINLVTNAAEAIKGDGTVKISTMNQYLDEPLTVYEEVKAGEYAVLSVSDDGLGISYDDIERIFEPFYTKKVMGRSGTGLGLAVVWNTIQDHSGYINVKTSGKGTTFELYFPVTRDEAAHEKIEISMKDYIGHGERILVVDDEEQQREIACNILVRLDYKAEAVSSGEEAVDYLKDKSVDLVVLDMIMPKGMDGRETFEEILKIHPKQKAIIASGFSETIDVKKAQSLGAGKYIKKPYTMEKIGLAVKEELEK